MKNIIIAQIVGDVILIVLNGYSGFTSQSTIDLFAAFIWFLFLLLHIYILGRIKQGEEMIKIISSEEHAKLTGDIDYWKARALEEERSKNFYKTLYKEEKSWHIFYKEEHGKRISEYMTLKEKYNELEKEKLTNVSLGEIKNLNKAKEMAEEVIKEFNNEHQCDRNCFAEHILPAIQSDYDSIDSKNRVAKYLFINYWYDNLVAFYPWLKQLYSINGKIRFK